MKCPVPNNLIVNIKRYSPEEKIEKFDQYNVPFKNNLTIQGLLCYIFEKIDPTLAYRDYRCGHGICGVCQVKVNGKRIRACEMLARDECQITIEPISDKLVKDLVVK